MADRTPKATAPNERRWRTGALLWLAGLVTALLLAASTSNSFAAFAAAIAPGVDVTTAGTLAMTVAGPDGSSPCSSTDGSHGTNAAVCSTLNRYGSTPLAPERTVTTTLVVTNRGTRTAAGFTLAFGPCHTNPPAGPGYGHAPDLCRQVNLAITRRSGSITTSVVEPTANTLAELGEHGAYVLPRVVPGASVVLTLRTTMSATAGNACQGLTADQSLTLQFTG